MRLKFGIILWWEEEEEAGGIVHRVCMWDNKGGGVITWDSGEEGDTSKIEDDKAKEADDKPQSVTQAV